MHCSCLNRSLSFSSKARLFASLLSALFSAVFNEVESDWLSGSHAHFLDADWLAAESGLAASLPSLFQADGKLPSWSVEIRQLMASCQADPWRSDSWCPDGRCWCWVNPYGGSNRSIITSKIKILVCLGLNWATRHWGWRVIIGGKVSPNKVILSENNVFV